VTSIEVENLLSARLGFDIESVGRKAVETVLRQSMKEAGFSDPAAYARMLRESANGWDSFVERVVIPETWFFRDVVPFELCANWARVRMRGQPSKVLRILSCPCSTGEEPYSLVMAMLQSGIAADSFTVDAFDVSRGALTFAQAAIFNERSFRDDTPWYRATYFDPGQNRGTWRLRSSAASKVRFQHGNLISNEFLIDAEPYDLVFCRNLLIYLHSEARLSAVATLQRLTAEDGLLVVGHAEAAFARERGFKLMEPAAAFAFVKNGHRPSSKPRVNSRSEPLPNRTASPAAATGSAVPDMKQETALARPPEDTELASLAAARRLGDAGKLHEALHVCGEYLRRVPKSAEGHFLVGVLYDALGQMDLAIKSFRKSLYLDPSHRESLFHLALKHEARGDAPGAALLRERARRAPNDEATE
jgi:chemotaxis protein methyltransferase WspC